jgi:phytol kinase
MTLSNSIQIEIILGIFAVLLGALAIVRSCWRCTPEFLRKAMHVGMGFVAFLLPWLFVAHRPVALLAGLIIVLLVAVRVPGPLRKTLGGVIHDVGRESWGEIYFALGVAGLFMLSHGEPLYYGISILTLVLADTAASLIGCRHGFLRYHVLGEFKSLEGSLAFLMTAFLIGALGLSLFGPCGITVSLVIALSFALPATLVEAVASKGTDNFFVPLCSFALLKILLTLSPFGLAVFLSVVLATVPSVFMFLYDRSYPDVAREAVSTVAKHSALRCVNLSAGSPGQMTIGKLDDDGSSPLNRQKARPASNTPGSGRTNAREPILMDVPTSHRIARPAA